LSLIARLFDIFIPVIYADSYYDNDNEQIMKPDFTDLYARWKSGMPRKEKMTLNVQNDKSLGSIHTFSDEQISFFRKKCVKNTREKRLR